METTLATLPVGDGDTAEVLAESIQDLVAVIARPTPNRAALPVKAAAARAAAAPLGQHAPALRDLVEQVIQAIQTV